MIPRSIRPLDVAALIALVLGLFVWSYLTGGYSRGPSDFTQDYAAARLLLEGRSIYGESVETYTREVLGFSGHLNFHPPTNAVYFVPLALLPYDVAFITWNLLNLILFVWIVVTAQRLYPLPVNTVILVAFALLWWPFIQAIALGQSSIVITAAIIKGWLELRRGRSYTGGAWWGLAATIKLFPAFLGLHLLMTRDGRAITTMVGTFLLLSGLSTAIVGLPDTVTFITTVIPEDVRDWSSYPLNCSIYGVLLPLLSVTQYVAPLLALSHETVVGIAKVCALFLAGGAALVSYRAVRSDRLDDSFHTIVVTMLLISPITWVHIFPVLIPTAAYLFRRASLPGERTWVLVALFLLSEPNILTTRAAVAFFSPDLIPWQFYLLLRVATLGLVILLWLSARTTYRGFSRG